MSKTTDDKTCSKINDKPVDAIGHIKSSFDFDIFTSEFYVEKVFGLIVQGTNQVLRFKLSKHCRPTAHGSVGSKFWHM